MATKRKPAIEPDTSDAGEDELFEQELAELRTEYPKEHAGDSTAERELPASVEPTRPEATKKNGTPPGTQTTQMGRKPQTVPIDVDQAQSTTVPEASLFNEISEVSRKPTKTEAKQTAVVLMSLLDGAATMLVGSEARMNEVEKELIREPLARIMQRMDFVTNELLSKWSDPILLGMGLLAWISRISHLQKIPEVESDNSYSANQSNANTPQNAADNSETIDKVNWRQDPVITQSFRSEAIKL